MRQLYELLGVGPGATDAEIKAAFRRLAKQLHPDLNPEDADGEQRLQAVLRAYRTLSDPPLRAAYDAHLATQRSMRRWRLAVRTTTMLIAFALTVGTVLLWRELTEAGDIPAWLSAGEGRPRSAPPMPDRRTEELVSASLADPKPTKAPPQPDAAEVKAPVVAAPSQTGPPVVRDAVSQAVVLSKKDTVSPVLSKVDDAWASYRDARFGFALEYPFQVFLPDPEPRGDGKSFVSRDGRARLLISAALNTTGMTLVKHRRSLMEGPYKGATFDYTLQRGSWFVLSGVLVTDMFYERVTFSCDGQAHHGWKLVYPLSERAIYDRIVEEVHRRYRHESGGAGCAK